MNFPTWQRKGTVMAVGLVGFVVFVGALFFSFQWVNQPFPGFFLYDNLNVAPYFLPYWSGEKEGLRFLDRLSTIQDAPVAGRQAVYRLVRSQPAGTLFRYTFEREGEIIHAAVPSMKFSLHDWLLSFGSYVLTAVGFLVIGSTPFYLRPALPAARVLFFMVNVIFFWFVSTFDFLTAGALPKEVRIFGICLTPSAGVHLALLLTGSDKKRGAFFSIVAFYAISIVLGLFYSLTFYGSSDLWLFALRASYAYTCAGAVGFLFILWRGLKRSVSDLERSRLRVVWLGAVLGFLIPTLGTVLVSVFYWKLPYNLLLIPTVFFPLSVAYALLKYSLFDLDMILKAGLTRAALTAALLLTYVLVVSALSASVGIYEQDFWIPFLFSVLVVLIFNPLLRWIEGLIDHYLYPREYDPAELQGEVSSALRSLARPGEVAERYLRSVAHHIRMEEAAIFFRPESEKPYTAVFLTGRDRDGQQALDTLSSFWNWNRHLGRQRRALSKEEVRSDPLYEDRRDALWNALEAIDSQLVISISFERRILGFVSFGPKRSGKGYSADDLRLLCNLTDQLALALENGMLFEESEQAKEEYQRLYDQSEIMNQRLVETDRLKKQFVANICHELRTPVSAIVGYAEVLIDPGFSGGARPILERVVTNGQDLSQLMDSLMNFAELESDAMATSFQAVNVRELLHSLEIMARRLIKNRPIAFRIEMSAAPDTIQTDPKKLQQILMQLFTNAVKFTERGEIGLEVHTVSEVTARFVEIAVSDTGIGIDKRDQEIIFEEFRQLDGSSTRHYGGTGLGLNLCKKLAESLGGKITVESEIGRGSTFSLLLPWREPLGEASGLNNGVV